jgi:hypothetical protein
VVTDAAGVGGSVGAVADVWDDEREHEAAINAVSTIAVVR